MAKKYVDVEEILKHKRKMRGFGLSSEEEFWDFAVLVEDINNTPAADVEEVRHGKWLFIEEPNTVDTCGNKVYHAQCSECGFTWTDLYAVRKYFKGCPCCTAKMECPSVFEVWKDCELGQTYKVHTFYIKEDADEWVNKNEKYYPGWHLRVAEVKE